MRQTLVIVAVFLGCLSAALAHTSIEFEQDSHGYNHDLKIRSKNKNANVNDIKIGNGHDHSSGIDLHGAADSESININWSGSDSDHSHHHSHGSDSDHSHDSQWWDKWTTPDPDSSSGGLPNPTVPTTPETTTISQLCTCDFTNSTFEDSGEAGQCSFPWEDVDAHCKKWEFSPCRAVCTAAMTLHWEQCTPTNVRTIWCKCPYLGFDGRSFSVPDIRPDSSLFYKFRYKTCWKQCYNSGFDRPWSWESGSNSGNSHSHSHSHSGGDYQHSHEDWNNYSWETGRNSPYKK